MSLAPVVKRLSRLLDKEVKLAPDCVGEEVKKMVKEMKPGEIIFLENLRFHAGETANDPQFAKELASLADIYINDAFAVCHRVNASVVGVPKYSKVCAAGFLLKDELNYFRQALECPTRPLVSMVGGSKVSSKLDALENLLGKVDKLIIGGAMANTFLKAFGYEVGKSLVEDDLLETAKGLARKAKNNGIKLYLPVDCVVAEAMEPSAETKIVPIQEVPKKWFILDIGPATSVLFGEALQNARTIVWNGPMGAFELDAFSRGTLTMVDYIANSYALTIAGGGDTDVAINKAGALGKFSYISTGGGAFLELLEGKELPGVSALEECEKETKDD
jgi:phosphoglycerate kinase